MRKLILFALILLPRLALADSTTVMYDQISEKNLCKFMATNLKDYIDIPCSDMVQEDILNHAVQQTDSSKWFVITYANNNGAMELISYDMLISADFEDYRENATCVFSRRDRTVSMSCSKDILDAYDGNAMDVFYSTDAHSGERTMLAYSKDFRGWYLPELSKENCTFHNGANSIELPCDNTIRNAIKDNADRQLKLTYWYDDREKTKGIAKYSFEYTDIRFAQAVLKAVNTDEGLCTFSIDGVEEKIFYNPIDFDMQKHVGKSMYIQYYFEGSASALYSFSLK